MGQYRTKQLTAIATLVISCTMLPFSTASADNIPNRIFEMRTYSVTEPDAGKLHKLFEDHSGRFFIKYGIQVIALWTPHQVDNPRQQLVCLFAHTTEQKALDAWQAFENDPKWQKLVAEYGMDVGTLSRVKSEFFDPTHYSPLK